jgi:predicted Holliday junction resolvase-like endonuclease
MFNHGKKIGIMMIVLITLMIGGYLYTSYIIEPKETIATLKKELSDTKTKLESCEVGAKVHMNSALNEQSFKEVNKTIEELKNEDKKLNNDNLSVTNDEYLNWVF